MTLKPLNRVLEKSISTLRTGNDKIDSFFSFDGGFELNSTIVLTGTSGAGKTSFAAELMKSMPDKKVALYSREMPSFRVKKQISRFDISHDNALIADRNDCSSIYEFVEELNKVKPDLVFIDSLSVLLKEDCGGTERELYDMIDYLRSWVENNSSTLILIGHETKGGEIKGAVEIKYMNDAHMRMVYDEKTGERIMSWTKNRSGDINKVLYYEFNEGGMSFYTEDEWYNKKNEVSNKNISEFVFDSMCSYLGSIDKKNVEYKNFKSEYKNMISKLNEDNDLNFNFEMMKIIDFLTKKYNLI